MLMGVGMITVFAILLIVIYLSKLLILLVNKYAPEEVAAAAKGQTSGVSPTVMRVISAAVAKLTGGKGSVQSVEKI